MFAVCRMERYFPPGRTDLVELILPDKMLKDHGKLAALSAVSCFMERILTRVHNQFKQIVPRYLHDRLKHHFRVMRTTCELFSWESMQTGRTDQSTIFNSRILQPDIQSEKDANSKRISGFCSIRF